jgi:hypothetical protein
VQKSTMAEHFPAEGAMNQERTRNFFNNTESGQSNFPALTTLSTSGI